MVMKIGGKDESRIINEKQFIKSRLVAKEVVKRLNSDRSNRMHIFDTRRYYPKGERVRRIIKEMVTFGLYVLGQKKHKLNIDVPYDDSIGEKYASRIIKICHLELKVTLI